MSDATWPEPPTTSTRHALKAEWDAGRLELTVRQKPEPRWFIGVMSWLLSVFSIGFGLLVATGDPAMMGLILLSLLPMVFPLTWRQLNGPSVSIQATPTSLQIGERILPWSAISGIDVPSGVQGFRLKMVDGTEQLVALLAMYDFQDLEWVASCLEAARQRSVAMGRAEEVPSELDRMRAAAQSAGQRETR